MTSCRSAAKSCSRSSETLLNEQSCYHATILLCVCEAALANMTAARLIHGRTRQRPSRHILTSRNMLTLQRLVATVWLSWAPRPRRAQHAARVDPAHDGGFARVCDCRPAISARHTCISKRPARRDDDVEAATPARRRAWLAMRTAWATARPLWAAIPLVTVTKTHFPALAWLSGIRRGRNGLGLGMFGRRAVTPLASLNSSPFLLHHHRFSPVCFVLSALLQLMDCPPAGVDCTI
jgi:hypothetical protein